jgi:hypothetical protein
MATIKIKRGTKANLPSSANQGEPIYTTDSKELFVGSGSGIDQITYKNNFAATADPTVNNDSTQGYSKGSKWYNTNTNKIFECLNNSAGAAVWVSAQAAIETLSARVGFFDM